MEDLFIQYEKELKDILRYLIFKAEKLENWGIYNGKLGVVILFYEYSRYSTDKLYEEFADKIIDSVLRLPNDLSYRFSDGLSGIGWGIIYLMSRNFIEGDIDDILFEIDKKIALIDNNDILVCNDINPYLFIKDEYRNNRSIEISIEKKNILREIWMTNIVSHF